MQTHIQNHIKVNSDINPFQIFILILSLHVVVSSFLQLIFTFSPNVTEILTSVDNTICLFFFTDFIIRFYQAESKLHFMKWGWVDLLSSIPMVQQLQLIRIIRIARILKSIQHIRSSKIIFKMIFEHRFKATFSLVSAISFILVTSGAIGILLLEHGQEG
ncbi:MAG: ion transporter, partial [Moritella sp.]|uniref:ion transporter n=1 Tax=Moritella sp. TaxID=78556 RepID=UPI0029B36ECF